MNAWCGHMKRMLAVWGLILLMGCGQEPGPEQTFMPEILNGRWLVINYWAEWCNPCRKEIPELNKLSGQLNESGEPVTVIGVNYDELQSEALARAIRTMGITFQVLPEDPSAHLSFSRPQVLPATYIVDSGGQVRKRLLGEQSAISLMEQLRLLGAVE